MDYDAQESIREIWREFDSSCGKRLPLDQVRLVFLALGRDVSEKDLNAVAKGGSNATIDMLNEFLAMLPKTQTSSQDITNSVTVLSQYTGGQLKTAELRLLLCTQGERLSNDEAAALVSDSDPHSSGYVDVGAFAGRICKD